MGKYRAAMNWTGILHRVPEIMGLNLTRKGDKWQGGYYLNGRKHPYRRDKLKVWLWTHNDGTEIIVKEEGGDSMTLQRWLVEHGGALNYSQAYDIIQGNSTPIKEFVSQFVKESQEGKYVPEEVFAGYCKYDLARCNLFNFMCRLFGQQRVMEAWAKYYVTSTERGETCFWYVNNEGKICHDKIVRYLWNGKRDKSYGGSRKFKTADGYNQRCMFGAHLVQSDDEIVNIVESEKTAIACSIVYGGIWLACGGKNNLRDTDDRTRLFPDLDAVEEWREKGNVVEWWENCGVELDSHADILDMIEIKLRNGKKVELI